MNIFHLTIGWSFSIVFYFQQTQNKQMHQIESNQKEKKSQSEVRCEHQKNRCFGFFSLWRRPNHFLNLSVFDQLFCIGPVPSQLIVWQGRKCGVQGYYSIDISIGDYFLHFSARLVALTQAVFLCRWALKDRLFCKWFSVVKEEEPIF